ncbi:MAG: glycosyltransferase family 4 protein [Betaproteobacteria bacterium]|nr:glycosyltransferase family 4 protein [Betaproteobacteria bacterium]
MKLALVRQRYNPYGGAERFVAHTLEALSRSGGADITLIARSWPETVQIPDGTAWKMKRCDPPYSRLFGGRLARDRGFCQAVEREIAEGAYDIVQAHERIPGCTVFRAGDGIHAAWFARLRRARGPLGKLGLRLDSYHRYVLETERRMFAHPALRAVICVSKMVREEAIRHYGVPEDKLHLIYNSVDGALFHPGLAERYRAEIRVAHGIPAEAPLALFVGSGFERKGVPRLLAALAACRRRDIHLAVVGADKNTGAMQRLAARLGVGARVRFPGAQNDARPWYGAADLFALPALYDPFANACLEALSCGLPVIASATCGASELITPGENGAVCDAFDVTALAAHLEAFALPAETQKKSARAAVESLSPEAMSARLLGLYRALM